MTKGFLTEILRRANLKTKIHDRNIPMIPSLQRTLWMKSFWSTGFFAISCGGASLAVIKTYIENQDQNSSPA